MCAASHAGADSSTGGRGRGGGFRTVDGVCAVRFRGRRARGQPLARALRVRRVRATAGVDLAAERVRAARRHAARPAARQAALPRAAAGAWADPVSTGGYSGCSCGLFLNSIGGTRCKPRAAAGVVGSFGARALFTLPKPFDPLRCSSDLTARRCSGAPRSSVWSTATASSLSRSRRCAPPHAASARIAVLAESSAAGRSGTKACAHSLSFPLRYTKSWLATLPR